MRSLLLDSFGEIALVLLWVALRCFLGVDLALDMALFLISTLLFSKAHGIAPLCADDMLVEVTRIHWVRRSRAVCSMLRLKSSFSPFPGFRLTL